MSNDALWVSDAMLDSLSMQLRDAEARRAEAERAHQEALAQLRGMSSGMGRIGEPIETLQSRARELEKKAALETVRCEELQLELSAALKSRPGRGTTTTVPGSTSTSAMLSSLGGGCGGSSSGVGDVMGLSGSGPYSTSNHSTSMAGTAAATAYSSATSASNNPTGYGVGVGVGVSSSHNSSHLANTSAYERSLASYGVERSSTSTGVGGTLTGLGTTSIGLSGCNTSTYNHNVTSGGTIMGSSGSGGGGGGSGSTVTWAPTPTGGHQQGSEIDRIMAKIEQARLSIANDNRILAELEHPRTTGPIMSSGLGTSGLPSVSSVGLGLSSHHHHPHHHQQQQQQQQSQHLHQTSSLATQISTSAMLGGLSGLTGATVPTGSSTTSSERAALNAAAMAAGLSSITSGVGSMGVTSSASSHALTTDGQYSALTSSTGGSIGVGTGTGSGSTNHHYSTNANVSPLPSRANPMSTTMPPLCQSSTMPVLSLHNTHSIPSGSASYTLGLSVAPVASSYTFPTHSATTGGLASVLGTTGGVTGAGGGVSGLSGLGTGLNLTSTNPLTSTLGTNLSNYNTSSSYSTYTNPLLSGATGGLSSKLNIKPLDELDLLARYGQRGGTPCSPIPPANWGLDSYSGIDGVNPAFMHTQNRSLIDRMDLDARSHGLNLNGTGEPQVDMLDIPGKGRCCVFIARFSYDPPDVEGSEGELALCAGDYLLVWGNGEPQGGYFDAELLDGRRGLVPASFVQRLVGDDLLEFHQAVVSTLRDADDAPIPLDPAPLPSSNPLIPHTSEDLARISETHTDLGQDLDDEADSVPAPKHLTLERQLNKSVLIGWSQPDSPMCNQIESYHVYVDGVLKVTVKATERTRALVEGVDSNRPHRISVRSVTQNRRTSRDAACTMIIGRDTAHLGPSAVRATNITCSSAVISWLPANSNHQHVVCVNNVEVRTVKPGVYRHTITGLAPSTQYRVTVRAKHLRAPGQQQQQQQQQAPTAGPPPEEAPGAYTDFRTLAKGLPDPPQEIQVEAGPQDGTLLVTWQPVTRPPSSGPVTGYAVYADGKKVTDVDSPTGDHALIDIGKLVGLNPRAVTVRTKSRDSQSADSTPTMIPNQVRAAARNRNPAGAMQPQPGGGHMRNQRMMNNQGMGMANQMQQMNPNQVIDHDENLSDKEIYPGSMHQQGYRNQNMAGNVAGRQQNQQGPNQPYYGNQGPGQSQPGMAGQQQQQQQQPMQPGMNRNPNQQRPMNPNQPMVGSQNQQQQQQQRMAQGGVGPGQQMTPQNMQPYPPHLIGASKKPRYFLALFDYDPATMSPNPDACEEELPFNEGDTIKVYGEKDPDGFYWGELRGRRGFVPHNMVQEIEDGAQGGGVGPSVRGISRDRWGDIYANMPVKRMIALYDYDPQELSPNVDAEVELSFQTGAVILVYGDMDEDGFYMGELDGVRGLVPSNFLTEAPDQYSQQGGPAGNNLAQRTLNSSSNRGRGIGPGARGPPPPPRDAMMGGMGGMSQRGPQRKDARPSSPTLLDNTGHPAPDHQTQGMSGIGGMIGQGIGIGGNVGGMSGMQQQTPMQQQQMQTPMQQQQQQQQMRNNQQQPMMQQSHLQQQQQPMMQQQQQQPPVQPTTTASSGGGVFSTASNLLSGAAGAATGGLFGKKPATQQQQQQQQQPMQQQSSGPFSGFGIGGGQQQQQQQQQPMQQQAGGQPGQQQQQQQQPGGPNIMGKIQEMAAPGGDILSKGKELIFMKFGLGGK
ncbi:uncharacterized protein LOC126573072 isoform X6 [Anopheles aquasalis]|uniref:uncharacterized protein LOC126573072 isoform X6 n=1 Tax=Anopheles aquasalis TaxID=42839 RepID=UPI00215B2EA3|nr:uncharacterized protein LOC126573072 isoform X6 [Anopheles aquasalis]